MGSGMNGGACVAQQTAWWAGFRGFAAVLAASAIAVNVLSGMLAANGVTFEKLILKRRVFQARHFDCVAFGNSRVESGVDPREFDREMETRGIAVRSFNWGIQGLTAGDVDLMLEEVPAKRQPRLVLLQSDAAWYRLDDPLAAGVEARILNHFGSPGDVLGAMRRGSIGRDDALLLLMGRLLPVLRHRLTLRQFLWTAATFQWENYRRMREAVAHAGYADNPNPLSGSSQRIKPPRGETVFEVKEAAERIRKTAVRLRQRGVPAVVVEYPSCVYTPTDAYRRAVRRFFEEEDVVYLEFLGPEWYRREALFVDTGHLNAYGASLFTRALARELAAKWDRLGARVARGNGKRRRDASRGAEPARRERTGESEGSGHVV